MRRTDVAPARIASLIRAGDSDRAVADPAEDVRGLRMIDRDGRDVGKVTELMLDREQRHVRLLVVKAGGFLGLGAHRLLVPIDAITGVTADAVHIERPREEVAGGPPYDAELAGDAAYCAGIYGWYGYMPFWHPGYTYPSHRFTDAET